MSAPVTQPGPVLFHIGFPKCASTTLQRELFERHPGIHNFGKPRQKSDAASKLLVNGLRSCDDMNRDGIGHLSEVFVAQLQPDRLNVFSAEDYAFGPYWSTQRFQTADRATIARRLHALAPDAKVLVVVREQLAALQSVYAQFSIATKMPPFEDWVEDQLAQPPGLGSVLEALRYDDLLTYYGELFGAENILVLDLAEIGRDSGAAFTRITDTLGLSPPEGLAAASENTRKSSMETGLRRRMRRMPVLRKLAGGLSPEMKRHLRRGLSLVSKQVETGYTASQYERLLAYYEKPNRQLAQRWNTGQNWGKGPERNDKAATAAA